MREKSAGTFEAMLLNNFLRWLHHRDPVDVLPSNTTAMLLRARGNWELKENNSHGDGKEEE